MSHYEFMRVLTGETERLDLFFHRKYQKAKLKGDIEDKKKELLQDTALAVWEKLQQERYNDYNLTALIWLKAEDVWINFINNELKIPYVSIHDEDVVMMDTGYNPFAAIEQANWITSLHAIGSPYAWEMLQMHMDGFKYRYIAEHFRVSEASIKMKIYRLRGKFGQYPPGLGL